MAVMLLELYRWIRSWRSGCLRAMARRRPADEMLPSSGRSNAAVCYSLKATPLKDATPIALDVTACVRSPYASIEKTATWALLPAV